MALPTDPLAPASADAIAARNSLDWKRDGAEDAAKIYGKRAEAEDAADKYWLGDAAKTNGKRAEAEDAAKKSWF
ncbi:MAG: hypothetical protein HETSPECPRED_006671 [Heterodermia speciosa]|uniref:Uncharacterized protein n=1 Tax=Heterodermia speciosa TaxID=116794 RepID=A0A8H3FNB2_9LECA|nr:MAG: hypothetical protein HETSPECPRED_006671 [Heterodermia speciosa]